MKIILFIFLILYTSAIYSQSGWQQQSIVYTNQAAVTDVFFINPNTGWFCGQFGILSKTTNSGINWIHVPTSNNYNHNCIFFINENTGWVGLGTYFSTYYRGFILKTTTGGNTWVADTLPEEYNIVSKITFINLTTGWASAKGVYKTTNAGLTWSRYFVQGYEIYDIRSISFPDLNTGYCSGTFYNNYTGERRDIISKSTNGGLNWQIIRQESSFSGSYRSYYDLQFLDNNTGYLCGNPPIKTTNGGNSWFNIMENTIYYSMHFINSNTGWFGKWDYSAITTNGGTSWVNQTISALTLFHGIYFVNETTGWGVGLNTASYPKVFRTTSGGFTGIQPISTEIPKQFSLSQNYPNPFNPMTKLKFQMSKGAFAKLTVFDVLGREVATLVNEQLQPGTYEVDFDGSNLPSGVYYYKLETETFTETKKMVLIK